MPRQGKVSRSLAPGGSVPPTHRHNRNIPRAEFLSLPDIFTMRENTGKSLVASQIELLWAHLHSGDVDLSFVEQQAKVLRDLAGFAQLASSLAEAGQPIWASIPLAA